MRRPWHYLMGCGHHAQIIDWRDKPLCLVCVGSTPQAARRVVEVEGPDAESKAKRKPVLGDDAPVSRAPMIERGLLT